jgi:hypothetical protein
MELRGEIRSHQRRERGKGGYVEGGVARQASRETYQGWERERSSMESPCKLRDRGFGREACQSVIRAQRGFKILPGNDTKMLLHTL